MVGVDIMEKMIDWSRLRSQVESVEDKTEFQVATVLDLPFDAGRFDVVFCESVLDLEVSDRVRRYCPKPERRG